MSTWGCDSVHDNNDMLPVLSGVNGGDWIACDMVSPGTGSRYPGMGGRCIASIKFFVPPSLEVLRDN